MDELSFHVPSRIRFGLDSLSRLGAIAASFGSRALVVTDTLLSEENLAPRLVAELEQAGVASILFDEIGPNSTSLAVERALEIGRAGHVQVVVGFGGIRSLSTAKCVARMIPVSALFDDYFPRAPGEEAAALPYVEVPTTCRDPFMLTDLAVVVDARNRRARLLRIGKRADWVVADPALALSLSPRYTVTTMMDTLLTAIEAYFARGSTFLSDTLCLRSIGIITSIIDELPDDPGRRDLRERVAEAGLLAALSLTVCGPGVGSAVAYAVGGRRMVPKSMVAAVMLPHVLDLVSEGQPKKTERIGNVLGEEIYGKPLSEFSVQVVDAVRQRMSLLRLPMRLKELDVSADEAADLAVVVRSLQEDISPGDALPVDQIEALIKRAV